MLCPLCHHTQSRMFHVEHRPRNREYRQCAHCQLVFVPARFHLNETDEQAEYALHENHFSDVGYHRFLGKATQALATVLTNNPPTWFCVLPDSRHTPWSEFDRDLTSNDIVDSFRYYCQTLGLEDNPSSLTPQHALDFIDFLQLTDLPTPHTTQTRISALDFGCGPMPALATQLSTLGCDVQVFDKYFFPDASPLAQHYDIITCTEVIEHVAEAHTVWTKLVGMLKPDGLLLVMTKRVLNAKRFATWHYKNDPTHICFYHEVTAHYLAQHFNLELQLPTSDIMLFKRKTTPAKQ